MNSFSFYNPVKVLYGAGEVRRVGEEAARAAAGLQPLTLRRYAFDRGRSIGAAIVCFAIRRTSRRNAGDRGSAGCTRTLGGSRG